MKKFLIISSLLFIYGCDTGSGTPTWKEQSNKDWAKTITWRENQKIARQEYVKQHPDLDNLTKDCIERQKIAKGMTLESAKVAWNTFNWKSEMKNSDGYEIWILSEIYYSYGTQSQRNDQYTVTCINEKIVSWTEWGQR